MRFTLSGPRQQVVDKARWVAKECLEPRAAGYDASAGHTWESWNDLWNHGLLAISVPTTYGGLGADMLTYIMAIESLAYGCTNSTMTLHMHSIVQQVINAIATPEQKEVFYRDVVEDGRVFGSWGSEPESRGGTRAGKRTVISPIEGGYVVNGRKHFCSMAGAAHRCMIHCAMRGYDGVDAFQLVLMPSDTPGISIEGEWNALGMRATVSPSVSFDECVVDRHCLLGEPGSVLKKGVIEGFGLGYAAVYLGAAQRALDFTVEYCKTHQFDPDPAPMSWNVVVQRNVAEMTMVLEGARQVLFKSAGLWESTNPANRAVLAARAKYSAASAALAVTSKCIQTVGGRAIRKGLPLERLYRDVRTATLMPPNSDRCMELVGKAELDVSED